MREATCFHPKTLQVLIKQGRQTTPSIVVGCTTIINLTVTCQLKLVEGKNWTTSLPYASVYEEFGDKTFFIQGFTFSVDYGPFEVIYPKKLNLYNFCIQELYSIHKVSKLGVVTLIL